MLSIEARQNPRNEANVDLRFGFGEDEYILEDLEATVILSLAQVMIAIAMDMLTRKETIQ